MLFDKRLADRPASGVFQSLAQQLGALAATEIRRHHADRPIRRDFPDIADQERRSAQRNRGATKGVFKSRLIMNFERDYSIDAGSLEQCRQVTNGDGVLGLGPPILPRIAKIGHHRRDPGCAGILQGADEEQQAAQLVVWALLRSAVQAMHDVNVATRDRVQRPTLMFDVLEAALLERSEMAPERPRDLLAEHLGAMQSKQA